MLVIDKNLKKIFLEIRDDIAANGGAISLTSLDYNQNDIDALVDAGYISKTDVSTLSGWEYTVELTRKGESASACENNPFKIKIDTFIRKGEEIGKNEVYSQGRDNEAECWPMYSKWMGEINIFNERHLKGHPLYSSINFTYINRHSKQAFEDMMGHLRALAADEEFLEKTDNTEKEIAVNTINVSQGLTNNHHPKAFTKENVGNKVFIVHGHDNESKQEMARFIERAGFEAVILHEQADGGLTIIEKIEKYTDVVFAVVLYTECDLGRAKEADITDFKFRARQNVVFEHGYLIAKLGRKNVCALVKGEVETPGDISGVVYTKMDSEGAWKTRLGKNMRDAGLNFDMNNI